MSATLQEVHPQARLALGDVTTVPVSVSLSPHLFLVQWLSVAASASAARSRFAATIAAAARPSAQPAYAALGLPGLDRIPDTVVTDRFDAGVDDHLEWLRDSSGGDLVAEISQLWGDQPPQPWRFARDRPRRWLRSLAHASADAWTVAEPHWLGGQARLQREVTRIGIAAVTGGLGALLNSLHPRLRFHDGQLSFRNRCSGSAALGERRLVLAPMLVPGDRILVSFDRPDVAYIAYPARRPDDRYASWRNHAAVGRLATVLGPIRAAALNGLSQARTMSDLASRLQCAPSTATYHCDQLEAAGLIVRERRGQAMWVTRTTRGEQLIDTLLA